MNCSTHWCCFVLLLAIGRPSSNCTEMIGALIKFQEVAMELAVRCMT